MPQQRQAPAMVDALESRVLFALTVGQTGDGTVTVTGTNGRDDVDVHFIGGDTPNEWQVVISDRIANGPPWVYQNPSAVWVDVLGDDDRVLVESSSSLNHHYVVVNGGPGGDDIYARDVSGEFVGGAGLDYFAVGDTGVYGAFVYGGDDWDIIDLWWGGYKFADGGAGDDFLYGASSDVAVEIDGGPGDDFIEGSDFNDLLTGGAGSDLLYGHGGADTFYVHGDNTADEVYGGDEPWDGVDFAYYGNGDLANLDGIEDEEYIAD